MYNINDNGRMHLSHLYVDFSIIHQNLQSICTKLNSIENIILVIKADGYGVGAIEYARQAEKMGIKSFAVARIEEAIELRKAKIKSEIIVLANCLQDSFHLLEKYNLITAITDSTSLTQLLKYTKEEKKNISIHINVNTGMNRLGISVKELDQIVTTINQNKFVSLKGIFTHFASADDTSSDFTHKQGILFTEIYNKYKPLYPDISFHASNSSGLMEFKNYTFDRVRIGIAALGYSASQINTPHWNVKPSLKLSSRIIQIQHIKAGEGVGYNQMFTASKEMKIATIGIGYADGVQRIFTTNGSVLVNNILCQVIGNISMDLISIDISSVNAELGQEVFIFGGTSEKQISIETVAKHINSVPYEVITQINPRVKRVYLNQL